MDEIVDLLDDIHAMPDISEEITLPDEEAAAFDPYDHPEKVYPDLEKPLDIDEDIFLKEETKTVETVPQKQPDKVDKSPISDNYFTPSEQSYTDKLQTGEDYVFDPHVAADELGLPVDLIEEFIRDFIQQSHEFHDEILESVAKSDFDNVKILSHKLKGVAANLRVEDAFEMLSIINNSHDQTEIEALLKSFYRTIAKLEGKEVASAAPASAPEEPSEPAQEIAQEIAPEESLDEDIYAEATLSFDAAACRAIVTVDYVAVNNWSIGLKNMAQDWIDDELPNMWPDEVCVEYIVVEPGTISIVGYRK